MISMIGALQPQNPVVEVYLAQVYKDSLQLCRGVFVIKQIFEMENEMRGRFRFEQIKTDFDKQYTYY
jgi:hypothetical protein